MAVKPATMVTGPPAFEKKMVIWSALPVLLNKAATAMDKSVSQYVQPEQWVEQIRR